MSDSEEYDGGDFKLQLLEGEVVDLWRRRLKRLGGAPTLQHAKQFFDTYPGPLCRLYVREVRHFAKCSAGSLQCSRSHRSDPKSHLSYSAARRASNPSAPVVALAASQEEPSGWREVDPTSSGGSDCHRPLPPQAAAAAARRAGDGADQVCASLCAAWPLRLHHLQAWLASISRTDPMLDNELPSGLLLPTPARC